MIFHAIRRKTPYGHAWSGQPIRVWEQHATSGFSEQEKNIFYIFLKDNNVKSDVFVKYPAKTKHLGCNNRSLQDMNIIGGEVNNHADTFLTMKFIAPLNQLTYQPDLKFWLWSIILDLVNMFKVSHKLFKMATTWLCLVVSSFLIR